VGQRGLRIADLWRSARHDGKKETEIKEKLNEVNEKNALPLERLGGWHGFAKGCFDQPQLTMLPDLREN
jgi:hypothetical protein